MAQAAVVEASITQIRGLIHSLLTSIPTLLVWVFPDNSTLPILRQQLEIGDLSKRRITLVRLHLQAASISEDTDLLVRLTAMHHPVQATDKLSRRHHTAAKMAIGGVESIFDKYLSKINASSKATSCVLGAGKLLAKLVAELEKRAY